jgi:hypothetical protein
MLFVLKSKGLKELKSTVSRDFLPLVFFFKQLLLALVDKPSNNFDFFRIFPEIFNYFGASLVSLTPVNNSLPVSTTLVSDTFTVLESFTGVNDTGNKFLTGVIDTGKACICRCHSYRTVNIANFMHALPVSLTPLMHQ